MSDYVTTGETYNAVCDHLGWMPDARAVRVREAEGVVYVEGTLLKPDEWQSLHRHQGSRLPDGRLLAILAREPRSGQRAEKDALFAARRAEPLADFWRQSALGG